VFNTSHLTLSHLSITIITIIIIQYYPITLHKGTSYTPIPRKSISSHLMNFFRGFFTFRNSWIGLDPEFGVVAPGLQTPREWFVRMSKEPVIKPQHQSSRNILLYIICMCVCGAVCVSVNQTNKTKWKNTHTRAYLPVSVYIFYIFVLYIIYIYICTCVRFFCAAVSSA